MINGYGIEKGVPFRRPLIECGSWNKPKVLRENTSKFSIIVVLDLHILSNIVAKIQQICFLILSICIIMYSRRLSPLTFHGYVVFTRGIVHNNVHASSHYQLILTGFLAGEQMERCDGCISPDKHELGRSAISHIASYLCFPTLGNVSSYSNFSAVVVQLTDPSKYVSWDLFRGKNHKH